MFKNSYKLRLLLSLFVILSYQYAAYASGDYPGGESNPKRHKIGDTNKSDYSKDFYNPLDLDFIDHLDDSGPMYSIDNYGNVYEIPQTNTADKDGNTNAPTMPLFHNNNRDVKCMIVGFIPPKDLVSFSQVCKEALSLVQLRGRIKFKPNINILDGWTNLQLLDGVKVLNLSRCQLGSEGAKVLAKKLKNLPLLEELIFEKSELFKGPKGKTLDGFKVLMMRMGELNNLTHLNLGINLGSNLLTLQKLAILSTSIGKLTKLQKLRLPYSNFSDEGAMEDLLAEDESAENLLNMWPGKLEDLVNLKELDMTCFTFNESRGKSLPGVFANLTKLETLSLSNSNLELSDTVEITKSLAKLSGLRKLDLSYTSIHADDNKFMDFFSNLGNLTSLKNLNLACTLYEGNGMNELCNALPKLDKLSELNLAGILFLGKNYDGDRAKIKNAADVLFSTLKQLTQLTALDLHRNEIEQLYGRETFVAEIRDALTGLRSLKIEDDYDDNQTDVDSEEDDFYETSDES